MCYWNNEQSAFLFDCKEPGWLHPIYLMSGTKKVIGNKFENTELLT